MNSSVLSTREVLSQFEGAFGESGYAITAASVEKVLVGRLGDVPLYRGDAKPGKVPYDAMVWILDGETEITIDGKSLRAKAGDMVIMPANVPHALNAILPFKMALVMIKEK